MVTDLNALWDAFADAIAVSKEFDGVSVEEKLRQFGLEAADVKAVLTERFEAYKATFDPEHLDEFFVRAMLEGLLAGTKLRSESRDVA